MVKEGGLSSFDMGEFDLTFGERNLTVNYPNRTQSIYDVASIEGNKLILEKGDQKIMVVQNALTYLKHTVAASLNTYRSDEAPESISESQSPELVIYKCHNFDGNKTCDFE
jgi:hypothetical protein